MHQPLVRQPEQARGPVQALAQVPVRVLQPVLAQVPELRLCSWSNR